MYPRTSDVRASSAGFTVLEAAIGVIITGLLLAGITRFFTDSHKSFNLREKITERDQNGHYVLKHLEDRLMEAGANLPDSGTMLIVPGRTPEDAFSLVVNPRGGVQSIYSDMAAGTEVPLDDLTGFREAPEVLWVPYDKSKAPEVLEVAVRYGLGGYAKGLKKGVGGQDTLKLERPHAFSNGDALYAYSRRDYSLRDGKFTVKGLVLAENLEGVALTFQDAAGNPTKDWYAMRSARIAVTARTAEPDPANLQDAYRRKTLTSEVRLRNRP